MHHETSETHSGSILADGASLEQDGSSTSRTESGKIRRVFRESDLLKESMVNSFHTSNQRSWRSVGEFWLSELQKEQINAASGSAGNVSSNRNEEDCEREDNKGIPATPVHLFKLIDFRSAPTLALTKSWKWLDEEKFAGHLAESVKTTIRPEKECRFDSQEYNQKSDDALTDLDTKIGVVEDVNDDITRNVNQDENAKECSVSPEADRASSHGESAGKLTHDYEIGNGNISGYFGGRVEDEASARGLMEIEGLSRSCVVEYEKQARFLRAGALSLRASLLRNSTLIVDKSGADVDFTRSCVKQAQSAQELVSLLDRASSLLPELSKSITAGSTSMPLSTGFGNISDRSGLRLTQRQAAAMQKAKCLRSAHNAYAQRSRNWAKSRSSIIRANASVNRSRYYQMRNSNAKGEKVSGNFSPLQEYEEHLASSSSSTPFPSVEQATESSHANNQLRGSPIRANNSSPPLVRQHRVDRMVESRQSFLQREWKDNVEVEMKKPGSPGIDRPRLLRKGERALSPRLAASPSSAKFLLSISSSSPSLGRQTTTVPTHFVPGVQTAAALESMNPHGFQGRRCKALLRGVSSNDRDHLVRIALVEFRKKVSKLKTQRWGDLEAALEACGFKKAHAIPAPTDAKAIRRVVQQLIKYSHMSSAQTNKEETSNRSQQKVVSEDLENHLANRGTTSPVMSSSKIPFEISSMAHEDYVPYAIRKSPLKSSASSHRKKSLIQREVAKRSRVLSERAFREARSTANKHKTLETMDFERSVERNLRDRSWDSDYMAAVNSSREFMGLRNAEARLQRERERLRQERERKEASIANTAIPQNYQNRQLLRREIRRQARLELTQVEVEEVERLWAKDNFPNRRPMKRVKSKESMTARERVAAEIEKAMERQRRESSHAKGDKLPSYPTDPAEYAHLFDNASTNYDPSDSDLGDGYSEASSFDERFDFGM